MIWPALGRDRLFRLGSIPTTDGYPVESADQVVGYLKSFNSEAIFGVHIGSHFLRSPYSLAVLLWLSGPTVQEEVGRILAELARDGGPVETDSALRPG